MSLPKSGRKTKEQEKQERQRVMLMLFGGLIAIIVVALLSNLSLRPTPNTDPTYYTGNFMNHKGDVVSPDGRIIEKAKPGRSRQNAAAE